VFADLGLPNPEELLQKSKLVVAISDAIKDRGMSQIEASKLIGVSQPDLSKLLRGRTMSFTLDRLVAILNHLGKDVDLIVSSHPGDADVQGEFRVLQVVG
jgi:predicted XRE-type DNA-binding protein